MEDMLQLEMCVCVVERETEWKKEGEEQCVRPVTRLLSLVILKLFVWLSI